MLDEALNKCADNNNYTIYTSMCKAQRILMRSYSPVCSISGGSDSDIVLDLIHKVDEDGKVKYFWIDTGLNTPLLQKYSRCKTALQWWCGERYSDKDGIQKISRFSIYRNRFLKEFIMANPPDFPISNKCCEYSKKKPPQKN